MSGRHAAPKSPLRFTPLVWTVMILALVAILGGGTVGVRALIGGPARPVAAAKPDTRGVDTVLREVVVASARLAAYEQAAPDRQPVMLSRATDNLTKAANILATDALPGVPQVASTKAQDLIDDLATRVDRLVQCLNSASATAGASAAACADPTVIADNTAAARATGAAVADLRQYGSLSVAQVRAYADQMAKQATTEGQAGSTTVIRDPAGR